MLGGITYQAVCEVAQTCGIATRTGEISAAEVAQADELWLTSSVREMVPVVRLDGKPVGSGEVGGSVPPRACAWQAHLQSDDWLNE